MSHAMINIHDGILMELNFHEGEPYIEVLDGSWHYLQRYRVFPLRQDEQYQIERISDGRSVPPNGRFKNMIPLATMLSPHVITIKLASSTSRFIMRVLEDIVKWLSENVTDYWSFHIKDHILNIFFTSDDDAAWFRLCLVSPSSEQG